MSNQSFWEGNPKTMFAMGLVLGFAVSATVALLVMLSFLSSGKSLGLIGGGANNNVAVAPTGQQPTNQPPAQPVKAVDAKDHVRGNKSAKVTLIEYSDFQCPFCKAFTPTVEQALKDFPNDVRLVYRHFPLTQIHPLAQKAAEASECAAKLGGEDAFWKMHDKIFTKSPDIDVPALVTLAKELGLNEAKFKTCVDSGEMQAVVDAHATGGDAAGVQGTPATFVNGQMVSGAQPYTSLKAAIQAAGGKS